MTDTQVSGVISSPAPVDGEPVDDAERAGLELLERLAVQEAALFAAQARQLHDSAVLSRRLQGADGPERFLVIDLAGTLRIGQLAAGSRLAEAERLVADLPHLHDGLCTGAVLLGQARTVLEETRHCSSEVAAEVDRRLRALAAEPDGLRGWTARRLRTRVKALVLTAEAVLEPGATEARLETARTGRRVSVRPEPDGMGSLWALLPAEQLRTFTLGLDELHRRQLTLDRESGVVRTADQRRADLLADLPALALHALDGTAPTPSADGGCTHPRVVLSVHVPLATLQGRSEEPGLLDGYGPISASHVRRLLPRARLQRVVVDDRTGEPIAVDPPLRTDSAPYADAHETPADLTGIVAADLVAAVPDAHNALRPAAPDAHRPPPLDARRLAVLLDTPLAVGPPETGYRPSASLARLVRLRDPLCDGPGCATSSRHCDLDHEVPWPAGPTCANNLRPRSRRCHRAKTLTWIVVRGADGSTTWRSPTGRRYRVPPAWAPPARTPPEQTPPPGPRHAAPERPRPPGPVAGSGTEAPGLADLLPCLLPAPAPFVTSPRSDRERLSSDDPPPF